MLRDGIRRGDIVTASSVIFSAVTFSWNLRKVLSDEGLITPEEYAEKCHVIIGEI